MDRDKAIDRVRKLINHATSNGERYSEAEVETYLKHARKLMDEFNIEESEALAGNNVDAKESAFQSMREEDVYSRASRLDRFMVQLGHAPALICDVGFYLGKRGGRQTITYYGLPRDVAVASELYKELLIAMRTMCKVRYGDARPPEYKMYCLGFATRITTRARALKTSSTSDAASTGTAIILAKDVLLERFKSEKLDLAKPRKSALKISNYDAYITGENDGDKVSIDTNQVKNTSKPTPRIG